MVLRESEHKREKKHEFELDRCGPRYGVGFFPELYFSCYAIIILK